MLDLRSSAPGSIVVIAGVAAIVVGLAWRIISSVWATRRMRARLADPHPVVRCAAVAAATSGGLQRHAGRLLELARQDPDAEVRHAVLEAVRRNLWEPLDDPNMLELRLWAEGRGAKRSAPAKATGERVLVTGGGGPAGVSVIRALRAAGHVVIGVDADPLAAGVHLSDEAGVVPPADEPEFVDLLLDVAHDHGATALIPTITEEMCALARRRDEVCEIVPMWIPSLDALETCRDKWLFAQVLDEAGVRAPRTAAGSANGVPGPWIVKPRAARGSRGVLHVERIEDLRAAIDATDDAIVQTCVEGQEFTVDVLVSSDGELVGAVPRWRLETKAGISTKGRTFADDDVLRGVANVIATVGLDGPANVQGFATDDGPCYIEVNPRFSGGLPLTLAAGADLVGEYLRGILGLPLRPERLAFREGTTMIRHFEEIYA